MNPVFRAYQEKDYPECEALVNQAWHFDKIIHSQALSALAKNLYTEGALRESNFQKIIEIDDNVAGFLFGFNDKLGKPKLNLAYRIKSLWRLIRVKSQKPEEKKTYIEAIAKHSKNRSVILPKRKSEIVLFVVHEQYRSQGFGEKLWLAFLGECQNKDVASIVVETNLLGAAKFYEKLGFEHLANFHSPLHELATPKGQACILQFNCSE